MPAVSPELTRAKTGAERGQGEAAAVERRGEQQASMEKRRVSRKGFLARTDDGLDPKSVGRAGLS
jgi:hypothetical protein